MLRKNIIYIVLFFLGISCNKIVEINLPPFQPKIIVNSLFSPDSIFTVNISRISDYKDTLPGFIDDAVCKLYADNHYLFDFKYLDSGFYIAPGGYKPVVGIKYKIKVVAPNLPEVWAEDSIPAYLPIISNIKIQDSAEYQADKTYHFYSKLSFNFTDNKNTSNFYEIVLFERDDSIALLPDTVISEEGDTVINGVYLFNHILHVEGHDPVLTNEGLMNYYPFYYPFSDLLISGTHKFRILYSPQDYQLDTATNYSTGISTGIHSIAYYTLFITIRSVSKAYYRFYKKLILHENNQTGDFWTGTGSPVTMFSNIHNGYGIFAGYQEIVDSLNNYPHKSKYIRKQSKE